MFRPKRRARDKVGHAQAQSGRMVRLRHQDGKMIPFSRFSAPHSGLRSVTLGIPDSRAVCSRTPGIAMIPRKADRAVGEHVRQGGIRRPVRYRRVEQMRRIAPALVDTAAAVGVIGKARHAPPWRWSWETPVGQETPQGRECDGPHGASGDRENRRGSGAVAALRLRRARRVGDGLSRQGVVVSMGSAVVSFMRSIENLEVTLRQGRRRVRSR